MIQQLTRGFTQTRVFMDTPVMIELAAPGHQEAELSRRVERAFGWFAEVEACCSRFDETSELRSLSRRFEEPVSVSPLLFSALELALETARLTNGALDPAIGGAMEAAGFTTNYVTGAQVTTPDAAGASYRDIIIDADARTVTLLRPLALDLGAVAKGFAIDLAGRELAGVPGFAINAGGDVLAHGRNAEGGPWRIGVRHPRRYDELLRTFCVSDGAVCTSGDYERPQPDGGGHHILMPASGRSATRAMSCTVIAPTAIVADALSTAAFVLGPIEGIELLEQQGVEGLIVDSDLSVSATRSICRYDL